MDVLAVTGASSSPATRDRTMFRVNEDEGAPPAMVQWTLGSYPSTTGSERLNISAVALERLAAIRGEA
jgi:hypothetical protein